MPYEGRAGIACWATFGPNVELRQTIYDFATAAEEIGRTGMPGVEEFLADLQNPPSAQQVAEFFEGIATSGDTGA
jgi:hypothetical protein